MRIDLTLSGINPDLLWRPVQANGPTALLPTSVAPVASRAGSVLERVEAAREAAAEAGYLKLGVTLGAEERIGQ
jgi:hypothetical protein